MSAQRNWLRLYRWARASRTINPNLQADMLIGLIKPAPCLIEMLDRMNDMTTAKKYYYAATFPFGRNCSTGEPNKKTGRMSKACRFHAFTSKKERDSFVENNHTAEAFSRRELRSLSLGSSVENFDFDVRCAEADADNHD